MNTDDFLPVAFIVLLFIVAFFLKKSKLWNNLVFNIIFVVLALVFIIYVIDTYGTSRLLSTGIILFGVVSVIFRKILPQLRKK